MGRRKIKPGAGKTALQGKDFRLAEEIDYIQARAAEHDGRLVSAGPLVLFSTETGDAWLLDPADHLAARIARDGDTEELYFEETDSSFAVGWKAITRSTVMPSSSSTATPPASPPSSAIPPAASLNWADLKISNIFG
jgi:hypothetical protein